MGKRRKGRDISGWLVVNKPSGPSSTDIVNRIRYLLNAKKAGHAGTLDPAATGILIIGFGEATKVIPHITDALKAYRFTVSFGVTTNTDDAEGEVIATSSSRPSDADIEEALHSFRGEISQIPPKFSAVKIDGQRAYALARAGEDIVLEPRPLWVEELDVLERPDDDHLVLQMVCGKGGYVRSIARDLGAALGCYGHVLSLRRLWSGPFDEAQALNFDMKDTELEEIEAHLLPLEHGLQHLPQQACSQIAATRLSNGNPAEVLSSGGAEFGETAWASHQGRAIAIGTYRAGMLHPARVFVQP